MFCPKCGTQNPETGRFCRNCGADLGNVSDALSGTLQKQMPQRIYDRKGKPISWESAIGKLFSGLGFLVAAIALAVTGAAGGHAWWFWLLIPGFGALGSGIAQLMQIKSSQKNNVSFVPPQNAFPYSPPNANLPPSPQSLTELQYLIDSGNKIQAIKVYRELYNVGLKEAKTAVEQLERQPVYRQDNYPEPPRGSIYDTGELTSPPSVTENTTRHLQIDKDGETMTLPKSNL